MHSISNSIMLMTFGQWDASSPESMNKSFENLKEYLNVNKTDILLLPEFPFDSWFCSLENYDETIWNNSIVQHDSMIKRLSELGVQIIIGSKPVTRSNGDRRNVGWIWQNGDLTEIHEKYYVPNEEGYWEANWYSRGVKRFKPYSFQLENSTISIGMQICTDLWFMDHSREYGQNGIHLLLCPRSTPASTITKWLSGARVSAVVSGAYSISSNHSGMAKDGTTLLGGVGWLCDPDGNMISESSDANTWLTAEIDLNLADEAKNNYPRYVPS